jgi:hypothetical protein
MMAARLPAGNHQLFLDLSALFNAAMMPRDCIEINLVIMQGISSVQKPRAE